MKDRNILQTSSISQAIALAQKKVKDNLLFDALDICEDVLEKFPMNRDSKKIIKNIRSDPASSLMAEEKFLEGNALYQRGDLEGALNCFKKSVRIAPNHFKSHFNMAVVFQNTGYLVDAIRSYIQVLAHNTSTPDVYSNAGAVLRDVRFSEYETEFDTFILQILEEGNYVRPSEICPAVISLLKKKPQIQSILKMFKSQSAPEKLTTIIEKLSEESLFLKIISLCPIPDLEFENMLTYVRAETLRIIHTMSCTSSFVRVLSSIAVQSYMNEYIYKKLDSENEILAEIESEISETIVDNTQTHVKKILILACYKPLYVYKWSAYIHKVSDLAAVVDLQVDQIEEEKKLASHIKSLKEISNSISIDVQEQYEASPYPRWVDLKVEKTSLTIHEVGRRARLKIPNESIYNCISPKVLIAGCGTGQQSIEAGSRLQNSKILAVDLSVASLSYAIRKTNEFGFTNIEYMQADILDLYNLDQTFDVIECCGVLHHMDDPFKGWQVLANCLNPGGLMKVALYSRSARDLVNDVREEIKELGVNTDPESIRRFRQMIIESEDQHHKAVCSFADFYCLSELRDLLFHVKEHQFTITEIEHMLTKLKLDFCGFESDGALNAFISQNPFPDGLYNLSAWSAFENQNLDIFSGMYQFWCQKRLI